MLRTITALIITLLLAACGGDEQTVTFPGDGASLVYSYPYDGQAEVPVHAPLVLRFSDAVTTSDPATELTLETGGGDSVGFTVESVAGDRSLVITPDAPLPAATDFLLEIGSLSAESGAVEVPEDGIAFTTRADSAGAGVRSRTDDVFRVARMIPDGGLLPLMDFSTLRLQFTQPVDRDSLEYGTSLRLEDSAGSLVPATVIATGPYITLDPGEELDPAETYTLSLTSGLESTTGNSLDPQQFDDLSVDPQNSRPRETLVQRAEVSHDDPAQQCDPEAADERLSPLTGMPINCVPVNAVLLGDESSSQQQGDVHAELAFVPNFPDVTPLRVPRGSLLTGSSVEVNIAGEVPAGYSTGDISVKFISDATGFLMPNPYSDRDDAPRRVRLYMDVAMNAETAEANGALSQDLMHLELVGTAIVEDGTMVINAVGVVEPEVLGLEKAHGTLSFRMEAYRDQDSAPVFVGETIPPELQSWVPGDDGAGDVRPGDPIILNFTEPLDRNSLAESGAVQLTRDGGTPVPFDWYLDGASLVVHPDNGLEYGVDYTLDLNSQVTDLAGNPLDQDYSKSFEMPHYVGTDHRAPIAITTYPGYPCVTTDLDLPNDDHGRCAGGLGTDDHLPVMDLPANRPIVVQFSQTMDQDSISLDGSFTVERNTADDGSGTWEAVDGRLEKRARLVRFYPEQPWEDGELYRYTLGSNDDKSSGTANCDGTDAICSQLPDGSTGFPLQTQILEQDADDAPDPTGGGPDMVIAFHGAPAAESVLQTMRNLPAIDVNSNFIYDGREGEDDDSGCTEETCEALAEQDGGGSYVVEENATRIEAVDTGGAATGAKVGCTFGESCPEKKFIWLTGGLNAEVVGADTHPVSGEPAVRVNVFPTMLVTSSLDVYADLLLLGEEHTPSGPQIMRMRYACDDPADDDCTDPEDTSDPRDRNASITGWIIDDGGTPVFETELDLYLDAPYLDPLGLTHNQHSYALSMTVRGPVSFLEDGRMQIQQLNLAAQSIEVSIGSGLATIDLEIPAGGAFLNFLPTPLKD